MDGWEELASFLSLPRSSLASSNLQVSTVPLFTMAGISDEAIRPDDSKRQRDTERLENHRILRKTPGRKERVKHHRNCLALRDKACEDAKRLPKITALPNPIDRQDEVITWHSLKPFAPTSMGNVSLILGLDNNNQIRHRLVRKSTPIPQRLRRAPEFFRGDLKNESHGVIYPLEWILHTLAGNAPEARHAVLKILGHSRMKGDGESTTIYTQYAAAGDLFDARYKHLDTKLKPIPAPFAYMLFQQLVDAGLIMKMGGLSEATARRNWREIIHRDLKPENIFLDLPRADYFPAYPQPKLADFGLAFLTSESDITNPHYWAGGTGTEDCRAPEQLAFEDPETQEPVDDFRMLSPCNVYGIGLVMLQVIHTGKAIKEPKWCGGGRHEVSTSKAERNAYPAALCDLIDGCLRFEPDERMTLEHLQSELARLIAEDDYLRNAAAGRRQDQDKDHWLFYDNTEKYNLGMVYA